MAFPNTMLTVGQIRESENHATRKHDTDNDPLPLRLQRCASIKPTESVDWVEICLLAIALLVGVLSFVAAVALCCLYSK